MQTQILTGRAKQVTLYSLIRSRTTEEVRTPVQRLLTSVNKGNLAVITHRGEVLGFVVKDLPESLKHLEPNAPTGALSQNLTIQSAVGMGKAGRGQDHLLRAASRLVCIAPVSRPASTSGAGVSL